MCNEVFGVNVVEVEKEVRQLVATYKAEGKEATMKKWGHKFSGTQQGKDILVAKFLDVLFEVGDEFINKVLETKDPLVLLSDDFTDSYDAGTPPLEGMNRLEDLASAWAIYNLPILQDVVDALIGCLTSNPYYVYDLGVVRHSVEDMLYDIEECDGRGVIPPFNTYVALYMIGFLYTCFKHIYMLNMYGRILELPMFDYDDYKKLTFDFDKVSEKDLKNLMYVWANFCSLDLSKTILLDYYQPFMKAAVREVLENATVEVAH